MDTFLLTFLLVIAVSLGGRDQLVVARLSDALEQSWSLLVVGALVCVASAGMMTLAGATLADVLPPQAADMLIAFALAIAAFELYWPVRLKAMEEPTRSLGAVGIVLLARQLGDAARFVIFALAAEATYPSVTVVGGALGGFAALALGWTMGVELEAKVPLRPIRLALGTCLIFAALLIGLNARYAFW